MHVYLFEQNMTWTTTTMHKGTIQSIYFLNYKANGNLLFTWLCNYSK